jgi:peptidoglycan hydrolase-like protein with peptidoglycan-binding domain
MRLKKVSIVLVFFGLLLTVGLSQQANAASKKAITHIQTGLQSLGYFHGKITGMMDKDMQAAVKAFQKDHGLKADGIPGKKTRIALNRAMKKKQMKKPAVSGTK